MPRIQPSGMVSADSWVVTFTRMRYGTTIYDVAPKLGGSDSCELAHTKSGRPAIERDDLEEFQMCDGESKMA